MRIEEQEQYLFEQLPVVSELGEIKQKIGEYQKVMETVEGLEKGTLGITQGIKDPKNHSPGGILTLYELIKKTVEGVNSLKETLGKAGYKIKVNGKRVILGYKNIIQPFEYRLSWAKSALGGLVKIYKSDIQKLISDMSKTASEMFAEYGL